MAVRALDCSLPRARDIFRPRCRSTRFPGHCRYREGPSPQRAREPTTMSSINRSEDHERRSPVAMAAHGASCTRCEAAIEFELSADEVLAPSSHSARTAHKDPWRIWGSALALSVVLATLVSAIALHDSSPFIERTPTATRMRATPATLSAPLFAPASRPLPVRYANPFDAVEFFEFPPGTSREYARAAVAEFLLDRARDRHIRRLQRSRTHRDVWDS
jgi:hypothetical protein